MYFIVITGINFKNTEQRDLERKRWRLVLSRFLQCYQIYQENENKTTFENSIYKITLSFLLYFFIELCFKKNSFHFPSKK